MNNDSQAQTTPATRPTTTTETRPVWESKTMWVNLLGGLVILIPLVTGNLPPDVTKWSTIALAVINMGLRLVTTGSVTLK